MIRVSSLPSYTTTRTGSVYVQLGWFVGLGSARLEFGKGGGRTCPSPYKWCLYLHAASYLLFNPAARGCNLAGAHEIANVFLEEFVVGVELVVLLLHGLDAVEYV